MTWLEQEIFYVDPLAISAGICIAFFAVLTLFYSWEYMPRTKGSLRYYLYILLTLATALGAVFAGNLIVLLVCWGLTGVFLYLLIGYGTKERTPATAKKALIIIGGTDAFMMLGIALMGDLGGSFDIQHIRLPLDHPPAVVAFLCLLIGILAKVGAIPLHTWIVDTAEDAPTPVTAFLPASVDKLLGIYLLARMVLDLFVMTPAINTVLLAIGTVTILWAGMMMLVQQDFKRLLGYCAVSQVGYVLLGIGTGHPLGIAGGLFHMVNHAIYKSCLFFSGGAVEQKSQTTDIERMGGMARQMPVIFVTFLIAALSVSGVPPLNGFASKWMVYQGIIETGKSGGTFWVLWLVVAMFGSAMTLAGMMKLVHAIFLGQPAADRHDTGDQSETTPLLLAIPPILLASLCILFGIWAYALPLKYLIFPIFEQELIFPGIWQPTLATVLILIGIGLGLILYISGRLAKIMRQTDVFIGGETLDAVPGMRVSGSAFYNTVQELPVFRSVFSLAQRGALDPYVMGSRITLRIHRYLGNFHTGILSTYLSWCLLGMGILFFVLLFR
jgi:formate hydrogenlyase subunit 3/multisubunit Na+/H+ antiporter MnhD subunit